MAYKQKRNKNFRRGGRSGLTSSTQRSKTGITSNFYELESAEVVSVIKNEEHPEYLNTEDIGKVKYRFIQSQKNKPVDQLNWAKPLSSRIISYPLIGEIILVGKFAGSWYYIDTINVSQNSNINNVPGISFAETGGSNGNSYEDESTGVGNTSTGNDSTRPGERFEINEDIRRLEHDEGDLIVEGRFENSIRFGSTKEGAANLIMKIGRPNEPEGPLAREMIDDDPTSLYLVEDQVLGLTPVTSESDEHYFFGDERNEFSGAQAALTTDNLIANIRNRIDAFASSSITLNTSDVLNINALNDINISTQSSCNERIIGSKLSEIDEDVNSIVGGNVTTNVSGFVEHTISDKVVWNVPNMYFGEEDESEPIVLGQTLVSLMNDLLSAIISQTHPTPTGPSGPPINSSQFSQIQSSLNDILSQQNFTQ